MCIKRYRISRRPGRVIKLQGVSSLHTVVTAVDRNPISLNNKKSCGEDKIRK